MMISRSRWLLIPLLVLGLALAACGGGELEVSVGEAFADVPLPVGAIQKSRETVEAFSRLYSSELDVAFPLEPSGEAEATLAEYTEVTSKSYEVAHSLDDVREFYKGHRDGWEEVLPKDQFFAKFRVVWVRNNGNRVVLILFVGIENDPDRTSLFITEGRR